MKKTKEEILETYFAKEFLDDQSENGGFWMKSEILGAMQEYADQFQPSEVMPSDEEIRNKITELSIKAQQGQSTMYLLMEFRDWFKSHLKPAEKEEKNVVYEFLYNSSCSESTSHTMSIHKTKKGAEMAMEFHKAEKQREWEKMRKIDEPKDPEYWKEFKWDFDQWWGVRETKIEE